MNSVKSSQRRSARHLTILALLSGMAVAVHAIESLLPPLFPMLPGVKLGLANIFSMYALMQHSWREGGSVAIVRCLLVMLINGSVTGFLYAIAGALSSIALMTVCKQLRLSVYVISIAGALSHNSAQICVAIAVTKTPSLIGYLPWLWICAVPTGLLIATLYQLIVRSVRKEAYLHN